MNFTMSQDGSSTSTEVFKHFQCIPTYIVPHQRQVYQKRRASKIPQEPNNVSLNELIFSCERSICWYRDIIFRKRNILWKAIKSMKLKSELSKSHFNDIREREISQNKDLTSLLQLQTIKSINNNIPLAKRRRVSSISLNADTDGNASFGQRENENSFFSDSSDNESEWSDNEGIIVHELTELDVPEINESRASFRKRRKCKKVEQKGNISEWPQEIQENTNLLKYWHNRYEIFHKYDEGIQLDKESWYSVTPERIAKQIARRCKCNIIIDAFCGAGGNTIQFAFTCNKVIAIDIDPMKIAYAQNNAKVYGVEEKIQFIIGDFLELAPNLKADIVFLSPPWGGPEYSATRVFDIESLLPVGGRDIYKAACRISTSVAYFLPRNVNVRQVRMLAKRGHGIETEQYLKRNKVIAVTCYYGELVTTEDR